jgi:hypothetical protein
MSEAIEKKIREAKEKHANKENFYNQEQGDKDLFKWLEECLDRAKRRKYNDIMVHLATIGKAMDNHPDETIGLTLSKKEVHLAVFLARAFEDISAIWFLDDLTMQNLRHTKKREFDRIIRNLKEKPSLKRPREEEPDEVPSKKQKFTEFEIDSDFEGWLTGEQEYLEGIDA